MNDFLNRPIDIGDYLLRSTGYLGNKPFTIHRVGKLVEYNNKSFYILEDRDDPTKIELVNDCSKFYKIPDGDLMIEKLQQG